MVTEVHVETRFGDLEMLLAIAPFDQDLAALQREKATLATAQQVAQARIVAGPEHNVSQHGSWVAENFVYFPSGQIFITPAKYSPILKHPAEATEAHGNGIEFHISEEEAASLEKLAKSGEVYTSKQTESYKIPIGRFAKDGLASFVFRDTTADYAKFLQEAGVKEVPVWLVDSKSVKEQKAPFAKALWHNGLYDRPDLDGGRGLINGYRARGVRKASEANMTQNGKSYENILQKYNIKSPDQLRQVLEKYSQIKGLVKE